MNFPEYKLLYNPRLWTFWRGGVGAEAVRIQGFPFGERDGANPWYTNQILKSQFFVFLFIRIHQQQFECSIFGWHICNFHTVKMTSNGA